MNGLFSYLVGGLLATISPEEETEKLNQCAELGWELVNVAVRKHRGHGRFAPLPIAASRTGLLGGTVATVGFPDIGLQGFAPKLAKGEIASLSGAGDDPRYFQISVVFADGHHAAGQMAGRAPSAGTSGALPENVNYAVKSSLLLSFLESVPAVSASLKAPVTADRKFEDVVKSAKAAAVLVLVY